MFPTIKENQNSYSEGKIFYFSFICRPKIKTNKKKNNKENKNCYKDGKSMPGSGWKLANLLSNTVCVDSKSCVDK